MAGLIDTNILIYAVNSDAPEHDQALNFVATNLAGGDAWYLTEGIVYEFLRVSTHANVFARPLSWEQGLEFMRAIWTRDNVAILTAGADHWPTLEDTLSHVRHPAGNLFFDIRSYVLMREHGINTIYTADTDFHQFDNIRVINPLRP